MVVYAERGGLRKELALISFVKLVNILFYLWGLALVRTPSEKEFKLHSSLVYPTGLTPTREALDRIPRARTKSHINQGVGVIQIDF